ncbi:16S rRNA (guanine(1207)-N(2))-methyltransferase RsmC [Sodalis-like secondary symbiont of Drepanosiphum platanoidis]|uniref:16S rRNA (guanine(1207)-N(2))-methyltransferase RsmC n=1 Tax=Sodalis-like secondary symbiont of Drepanosiphum platanoidis TaxID=2994493 RepID=UPI003463BD28
MYTKNNFNKIFKRHINKFNNKNIIFSGDIINFFPKEINLKNFKFHTFWFHHKKKLLKNKNNKIFFGLFKNNSFTKECNFLIYFWQKNKLENLFQILNIFSFLNKNCEIFIIGYKKYGVKSVFNLLKKWCFLSKIDNIGHCILFYGKLINIPSFNINFFLKKYNINSIIIKTLPGVFDYKKLDNGSKFLLSTLNEPFEGKIIDIGCGSGIISAFLANYNKNIDITLIDSYYSAILSSKLTFKKNNLNCNIISSDVYSNVCGKFDMIITNPPFHDKKNINFKIAKKIIYRSKKYLNIGGKIRIVANNFLPYSFMLEKTFGTYKILLKNNFFKVYEAINY